ncbi:MAG: iron ABC transporter permease [Bdellovibrionota bacterium]|nr:iron ABC transporter permease [Bdellovibrionota bacterium]
MIKVFLFLFLILGLYGDLFWGHPLSFNFNTMTGMEEVIYKQIRIPRVLVSFFAGCSMTLAGLLIQSSTRNPLSSPSVLGLNSCASFFVCTYLVFDKLSKGASLLGASFLGSLFGAVLLFFMGHFVDAKKFPGRIILIGVCLGMMMSSLTNLVVILDENNTQSLVYWLLGGVDGKSWSDFKWLAVPFSLCFGCSLFLIRSLDSLKLGDEMVLSLGHDPQKTRLLCLVLSLFLVSSVVAICGPLAFLGLIVPHLARKLFGDRMKMLLPFGTLFGGVFLIYADWFSRYIQFPYETPVGILSGLLGGAYFLYLSIKENLAHA